HSISATQALRGRGFQWSAWAAGVVAVALLALGAWWVVRQSARERRQTDRVAQETAGAGVGAGTMVAAVAKGGSGSVLATPATEPRTVASVAAPIAPPPAPSVAPTLPPPPKPSYAIVPAAWSDDV